VTTESLPPLADADRFDPPVLRVEWRTRTRLSFGQLLEELRARLERGAAERVLQHRGLQLDGRPVGPDDGPQSVPPGTRVVVWALAREPEPIAVDPARVLLDREGLVVVDKPAWLPVQGTRASQRFSLEEALRALLACASLRAVNRLDRETSGLALFARDGETASRLGRALAERRVRRSYVAAVSPPPPARFEVVGAMARVLDARRIRFALVAEGAPGSRPSRTTFLRLALRSDRALVRAEPATGRTHQIRVHLAAAGAPILGDRLYGGHVGAAAPRCLLHAFRAELRLPGSGQEVFLEAPLPPDFAAAGLPWPSGEGV